MQKVKRKNLEIFGSIKSKYKGRFDTENANVNTLNMTDLAF